MTAERITAAERAGFLAVHPGWCITDETLERTVEFADFPEAMGFVNRLALAAQTLDHHPDIDIRWNRVTLRLTTHSAAALTGLDQALAELIDSFLD